MSNTLSKTLRRGLAGILVLLVIAVLVIELMPWNFLKPMITDRVESATGRELEIRGDVSPGLLPRPHLTLNDVAFANADWAEASDMVTVERLTVVPSLLSLLQGEPVIDDLEISEPVVNLEGREQEPGNWVLPAMAESGENGQGNDGQKDDSAGQKQGAPVVIDEISVTDGKIRYLAPGSDTPHQLSLSSFEMSGNDVFLSAVASPALGKEPTELPIELSANIKPGYGDSHWQLNDIDARLGETRVSGRMGFDNSGETPAITTDLRVPSINVPDILAALPESEESPESEGIPVPILPVLAGGLRLTVDEVVLPAEVTLSNLQAHIEPGEHELSLETLRFGVAEGEIEAAARVVSTEEFFTAEARAGVQALDLHALGLGEQSGHRVAAELALGIDRVDQAPALEPKALLSQLHIDTARGSYRTTGAEKASDLEFILEQRGDPAAPVLLVDGRYQDKPLEMEVEGAPLAELAQGLTDYPLQAGARSGQLQARADTRLGALLTPATLAGELVLEGPDGGDLEQWIGPVLPPLPEFRVSGQVSRDPDRWSVTSLEGTIGASELTGEVHYTQADHPVVRVDLDADRIELAQFLEDEAPEDTDSADEGGTENGDNGDSPLAALRAFDGELDLTAGTLVLPNAPELEQFQVYAALEEGNLEIQPLAFNAGGGDWTSYATIDATSQPASGSISAEFSDIALSRFGDTFTAVEDRLGQMSGELNLDITGTLPQDRRDDVLLPFIGRLDFQPSQLEFRDPEAGTDLTLDLETRGDDAAGQRFHIDGDGQYDGAPFSLRFRGDPLLDARDPDRPWGVDLTSDIVDSRIAVAGTIDQPLALRGMDLELELEGPNPQRLSRLLGIPLPDMPPYSASGDLSLKDQRWIFSDITGQAGDSDLGGRVALDAGDVPPHLEAELSSSSLDIRDLGGLVGAEPGAPEDEESASGDDDGNGDLLPDEPIVTPAWRDLSADVRYRADDVRAADIPFSNVEIDFELEEGHARFNPVRFGVGDGRVDFNLDLDSRPEPPEGTMELEVQGVDLRRALRNWSLADDSVGTIGAQGKFWLTGSSLAELLASADGGLVLLMAQGKLDGLLVELAGLDASQAFLSWVNARDPIPINCSYVDLQTRDGVARIDTLAVDTDDTTFTGSGRINMNNEELDVTIDAHPKDFSVLSGRTPLHLGGTFSNVEAGLHEGEISARAGASAALAAIAGPLAALVPLLDLGTGDDVPYCDGLVSRSREAIDEDNGNGDTDDEN